jgi:diguanylate cyclase (GGDEF)-like protein/PAS domain S-box-containing protein
MPIDRKDIIGCESIEPLMPQTDECVSKIADEAREIISRHTPEGVYLYVSPTCQKLLGYEPEELIGLSPRSLIHLEDWPSIEQTQNNTCAYRMRHKAGHYVWLETTYNKIRDPKTRSIREIIAVSQDISDRMQTGEKERTIEQEHYLAKLAKLQSQLLNLEGDGDIENLVLKILGECSGADRVYLVENYDNDRGKLLAREKTRWQSENLAETQRISIWQNLSYEDFFSCWLKLLKQGEIITDLVENLPIQQVQLLKVSGILALSLVPLLLRQEFWGFIGFEYYKEARIARASEIEVFKVAAATLSLWRERKLLATQLRQSEAKYQSILTNIDRGFCQIAPDGTYLACNQALAKIYGYKSAEALMEDRVHTKLSFYVDKQRHKQLNNVLEQQGFFSGVESQIYRQDGRIIWICENVKAVRDENGKLLYYERMVEDITYRHFVAERLKYDTLHNSLTGMPNRTWFIKHLESVLASTKDNPLKSAVLLIDLDRFKFVNNSLGHLVGDELLQRVAQRLQAFLRKKDVIAHFGGDEFAILLSEIKSNQDAIEVAQAIESKLKMPFQLKKYEVFIGASIGIAVVNFNYERPEEILRDADLAMYQAKIKGKGIYALFEPQMQVGLLSRLQLESYLRKAIELDELRLNYQPIICLATGRLIGFEALVRWHHRLLGLIPPNEFIPVAEETGLIKDIGWWVFCEACNQLKLWREQFKNADLLKININLSTRQLKQVGLVEQIDLILSQNGLSGDLVKLEITETCFLETVASEACMVKLLKALGMGLCIDDFGTGYSSLSRLHEFPIDTLKIDRSFVNRLDSDRGNTTIRTIGTLAHSLGMNVVAEGIETREQLEKLQQLRCEYGQGYFFFKPLDSQKATKLIGDLSEVNYLVQAV